MPTAKTNWFIDTNLLVYALDPAEPEKRSRVGELLKACIASDRLVVSQQTLNELYRVVTDRKRLMPREHARRFVRGFAPFATAPLDVDVMARAWRIQDEEGFGWWDSLLLASASSAGCSHFASEDLQSGRKIGPLRIVNPFETSFEYN